MWEQGSRGAVLPRASSRDTCAGSRRVTTTTSRFCASAITMNVTRLQQPPPIHPGPARSASEAEDSTPDVRSFTLAHRCAQSPSI